MTEELDHFPGGWGATMKRDDRWGFPIIQTQSASSGTTLAHEPVMPADHLHTALAGGAPPGHQRVMGLGGDNASRSPCACARLMCQLGKRSNRALVMTPSSTQIVADNVIANTMRRAVITGSRRQAAVAVACAA
jgi:hypothetical protein